MQVEHIVANLVRIGIVTAVDSSKRQAQVKFQDIGVISGRLQVIQHNGAGLWMPKLNDVVLVLYLPVFNGDGFILGGL